MDSTAINACFHKEWENFIVTKMCGLSIGWLNKDEFSTSELQADEADEKFLSHFAYGIQGTACFNGITFDSGSTKILQAERYGGKGLGFNGGGVRCGTAGKYQLKGIGTNCLVGDHKDIAHSYGGLDAVSAIAEAIFARVFAMVMPLGAVKVYGLIITGTDTALDPFTGETCWGSILVREACLRPAHLLPTTSYIPHPTHRKNLRPDVARTRNIHRSLAAQFENHNQFIMYLGKYLGGCANQMAFARAARIMHSTLSPSNLGMDGRWLDVPLSGFVGSGENYALSSHFYSEPTDALNFGLEMLHTYSKFNNVLLNPAPLINYYNEQFESCFAHHLGFVFSLPTEQLMSACTAEWALLSRCAARVIGSAKEINRSKATPKTHDPIVSLIKGLFISTSNKEMGFSYLSTLGFPSRIIKECIDAFESILSHAVEIDGGTHPSMAAYATSNALIALKRARLSGIFYLSEVEREVRDLCAHGKPQDIAGIIDGYVSTGIWVFDNNLSGKITVLKISKYCLFYDKVTSTYELVNQTIDEESIIFSHRDIRKISDYILSNLNEELCIHNFSLQCFVDDLAEIGSFLQMPESGDL